MEFTHPAARDPGAAEPPGSLVIIGNFDGVHRGHQALLADAVAEAERRALQPLALTFHPHPALALGRTPPPVLTTRARKLELIERAQPALRVAVETFDRAFSEQRPEAFVRSVLVNHLGARVVVVGENFRFGHQRAGDFETLTRLGEAHGLETRAHPLVGDAEGPWSSTRIREAIARGELDAAARMLSRPHMLSGVVVQGDRRGRTIGFPTCNLDEVAEVLPSFGVYATLVDRILEEGGESVGEPTRAAALARGVMNLGVRPTVKDPATARPSVEVHLLDHDEDLYGAQLRVHLIARLRPERRFASLDELRAQIGRDAAEARALLDPLRKDPGARGAWR